MFEALAIQTTPVSGPIYQQTHFDKPRTGLPTVIAVSGSAKETGTAPSKIAASEESTTTVAELTMGGSRVPARLPVSSNSHSQLDKARNDRVMLLAKKYEGRLNREGSARLEILTQRLRRLSPRITERNLNVLTRLVEDVEDISSGIESLRQRISF